jgi:nitroreductase
MNTIQTIHARRAIKAFDPGHVMPPEIENEIFSATMQAPTAFNIQHWRFVVVRDPAVRKQIREVAWDQTQVTDASLLVILTGDVKAWEKDPARYWRNAPPEVAEFLVGAIGQYYEGKPQVQRDEVMRSCGLAGMTLMLAAKSLGYDSCPMDGFDFEKVAEIIQLPGDHIISFMVAIGKGTKDPWPKPGQLEASEVIRVI